jgi:pyridoxal phosphate enzyme (YggS family)
VSLESDIHARLSQVRARMARAADVAHRHPQSISLIAVSKTFGVDRVTAAASVGQLDFGENRVQEAVEKIDATAALGLRWHLIGHLQSNKARRAAERFAWIHSIDSADLLRGVEAAAVAAGTTPRLLVQVDLAGEPTKHGARPEELDGILAAASACQAARVVGLMLLPPFFDDPERTRPYFRQLCRVRDDLAARDIPASMLAHLSMGMSHDFEVAIQEGATMVRVGTAIFGERSPSLA